MAMGGGGQAGRIEYPAYIEAQHTDWLTNIDTIIEVDLVPGASPYQTAFAYNPTPNLDDMDERYEAWDTEVTDLSELDDFDEFLEQALSSIDAGLTGSTVITDLVAAYDNATLLPFQRSMGRWAAGMAQIGAVNGSAFVVGAALMEAQRNKDIDQYTSNVTEQKDRQRMQYGLLGVQLMAGMQARRIEAGRSATVMNAELERSKMVAQSERLQLDLSYDVQDQYYDLETYGYGGQMLASVTGASAGQKPPSRISTAMSGALGGLSQFGSLGSALGPEGAVLGAVFGGLFGGVTGFLGG